MTQADITKLLDAHAIIRDVAMLTTVTSHDISRAVGRLTNLAHQLDDIIDAVVEAHPELDPRPVRPEGAKPCPECYGMGDRLESSYGRDVAVLCRRCNGRGVAQ